MRLREAHIDLDNIGLVFFGDPAQCEPIGGDSMWTTKQSTEKKSRKKSHNKKIQQLSAEDGITDFRDLFKMKSLYELDCMKNKAKIDKLRTQKQLSEKQIAEIKAFDQEFGRQVYILADSGNKNTGRHGNS